MLYIQHFFDLILTPICGSILFLEGGIIFVILGIGIYYCCFNKKLFFLYFILYFAFCILYFSLQGLQPEFYIV